MAPQGEGSRAFEEDIPKGSFDFMESEGAPDFMEGDD